MIFDQQIRRLLVAVLAVAGVLVLTVRAQSAAPAEKTDAEKMYDRLTEAEDAQYDSLAERWQALVRQRQWIDATGKQKTFARYLEHDPEFKWVKLRIVVKTKDGQSYKDAQIPLAKLNKASQGVVKRIAAARKAVDAALKEIGEADPTGAAAGESDELAGGGELGERDAFGERGEAPTEGRGEYRGEVPPTEEAVPEGRPTLPPPDASAYSQPTTSSIPPLGVPAAPGQSSAPPAPAAKAPALDPNTPQMPDAAPWRTDFQAFSANLSMQQTPEGTTQLQWGELKPLEVGWKLVQKQQELMALPADKRPPISEMAKLALAAGTVQQALGEVAWEMTLTAPIADAKTEIGHDLVLQPPFTLTLLPEEKDAGDPTRFNPGDRVRFIGRFWKLGGTIDAPNFTLRVRFPAEQPPPSENRGEYRGEYRGEGRPPLEH